MREIYKKIDSKGFALIASMVVMTALILLGVYALNFTIGEHGISQSQSQATKTYYFAEAGINEMIHKVKSDYNTTQAFLNGSLNSSFTINRSDVLADPKASYLVTIISTGPATAQIIATSTYQIGNTVARRVIKADINKATNSTETWPSGLVAGGLDGYIKFTGNNGNYTETGGKIHANGFIQVTGNNTTVKINNGSLSAKQSITVAGNNSSIATPPPSYQSTPTSTTINLPQIDFNSAATTSWYNRANTKMTCTEFRNLFGNNQTINLTGVTYVSNCTGLTISGNNNTLNIKGILVIYGGITFGGNNLIFKISPETDHPENGAGILVSGNLTINGNNLSANVNGLIYTAGNLNIGGNNPILAFKGGIVCNSADFGHNNSTLNLIYDESVILPPLAPALNTDSPIIRINHWEEQY
ncbi:MAG: pilus assembly PilX N-terminal domain-containing protein [Candidatus Buchananbacteria bacterium]